MNTFPGWVCPREIAPKIVSYWLTQGQSMTEVALISIQQVNISWNVYTDHVLIKIQPTHDKDLFTQSQQKEFAAY